MVNGRAVETFLQYGVTNELADIADMAGLTATSVRTLSKANLVKFGLTTLQAEELKKCVLRTPIDQNVADLLLARSNFVCCVCKGQKSFSYILHHIVEHKNTQDNTYKNLAVLCPADHDLAHQGGLTLRLTKSQIERAKVSWEKQVEVTNAQRAARQIEVRDDAIDYVNVNRIEELCVRLFKKIPVTTLSASLRRAKIIKSDNSFDQRYVSENLSGGRYLFDYITHNETEHYRQLIQKIAEVTDFEDLDDAAKQGISILRGLEGRYAFFIGGVCAKGPKFPITNKTPSVLMHYARRGLRIEWLLDPMFLMSTSAITRVGGKNRYIVYCLVRTVEAAKEGVLVKASPLLIAQPVAYVDKTPAIAYRRSYERMVDMGWIEEDDAGDDAI